MGLFKLACPDLMIDQQPISPYILESILKRTLQVQVKAIWTRVFGKECPKGKLKRVAVSEIMEEVAALKSRNLDSYREIESLIRGPAFSTYMEVARNPPSRPNPQQTVEEIQAERSAFRLTPYPFHVFTRLLTIPHFTEIDFPSERQYSQLAWDITLKKEELEMIRRRALSVFLYLQDRAGTRKNHSFSGIDWDIQMGGSPRARLQDMRSRPQDLTTYFLDAYEKITAEPFSSVVKISAKRSRAAVADRAALQLVLAKEADYEWAEAWCANHGSTVPNNAPASREQAAERDVQVEVCRLSLRCPLSLQRIRYPIRGFHCKHLQCVDLLSFAHFYTTQLSIESLNFRQCPVCNAQSNKVDGLVCDRWFQHILSDPKFAQCDSVLVDPATKEYSLPPAAESGALAEESNYIDLTGVSDTLTLEEISKFSTPPTKRQKEAPQRREFSPVRVECIAVD